jgi:hypothetical protein
MDQRQMRLIQETRDFLRTVVEYWEAGEGAPRPLHHGALLFEDDRTVYEHTRSLLTRLENINA